MVLIVCDSTGKYLDGIRDGVIQSFRGAGLGYIKHIIDTEYLYLYDINRFSHIIWKEFHMAPPLKKCKIPDKKDSEKGLF